jgi:hypothetical protein
MNDDLMFEYLMQMGALQPDEEELRRKQAMVEALRANASQSPEGQMVSGHYVAPSITQYGAQLMNAYGARKGQEAVNLGMKNPNFDPNKPEGPENMPGLNQRQAMMLEQLKRRRSMGMGSAPVELGGG